MEDKRFQQEAPAPPGRRKPDSKKDSIFRDDWLADMEEILDELDYLFELEEAYLKAKYPSYPGCVSSRRR